MCCRVGEVGYCGASSRGPEWRGSSHSATSVRVSSTAEELLMAFRGHDEHSLDAKHRLSIPSKFREAFSDGLVLSKDSDACITVSSPEAHESRVKVALEGKNPLGPRVQAGPALLPGQLLRDRAGLRRPGDPARPLSSRTRRSRRRSWSRAWTTTSSCGPPTAGPSSDPAGPGDGGGDGLLGHPS